jgi:tRNA G46 methylase TrmB
MKTLATILKPYLRPLPLRPDKYLFQKDAGKGIISIQLKKLKHPVLLRKNTTDIPTFNEVFYWGEYAFDIPKAPETIVDCGANIGLASVYFANRFPNAKIIAIEPEQSNFEMLQKNAAPYPNITCLQYGIWNRTTHLE